MFRFVNVRHFEKAEMREVDISGVPDVSTYLRRSATKATNDTSDNSF